MDRFNAGEILVYRVYGLCKVKEIKEMTFSKNEAPQEYYVLVPVSGMPSLYYVPVGNEKAASRLRRPLTAEELDTVLSRVRDEKCQWIENRQLRSEFFNSVLSRGVTSELLSLIRCIYCRKSELSEKGKRLSTTDENIFSSAEKLLFEEIAFVLGIEKEKVSDYLGSYFSLK